MTDKHLIGEIMAGGVADRAAAEDMVARVVGAIAARLRAGRTVKLDGIGRLAGRAKWQDTYCRGPGRVWVTVVCLKNPAEIGRGESIPLSEPCP